MKKLLNVLYVTTPESYVGCDGDNVVVRVDSEERLRVPVHILESIVCFGYMGASPALMRLCGERGVGLSFVSEAGRFLGRLEGAVRGNVLLRREQYRIADDYLRSTQLASRFIMAKIANSRSVLRRAIRDHGDELDKGCLEAASARLLEGVRELMTCSDLDAIRGIEGDAAHTYFSHFNSLVLEQRESFLITGRNRRPPRDNMNSLLSFLYTLLLHDTQSALESVGLDPYVGFLHRDRPGRPSLALDLMEELRPHLADRLALTLVNRRQVTAQGFRRSESGGIVMTDATRKTVISAWQERKHEEIRHPFLEERVPIGLLPYTQALLLARYIRGDIDGYPPLLWP
jgi:CRISPR-associated protein Cas1